jgi:hypothetical protein
MELDVEKEIEDDQISEVRALENSEDISSTNEDSLEDEDLSIPLEIVKKKIFNVKSIIRISYPIGTSIL